MYMYFHYFYFLKFEDHMTWFPTPSPASIPTNTCKQVRKSVQPFYIINLHSE